MTEGVMTVVQHLIEPRGKGRPLPGMTGEDHRRMQALAVSEGMALGYIRRVPGQPTCALCDRELADTDRIRRVPHTSRSGHNVACAPHCPDEED